MFSFNERHLLASSSSLFSFLIVCLFFNGNNAVMSVVFPCGRYILKYLFSIVCHALSSPLHIREGTYRTLLQNNAFHAARVCQRGHLLRDSLQCLDKTLDAGDKSNACLWECERTAIQPIMQSCAASLPRWDSYREWIAALWREEQKYPQKMLKNIYGSQVTVDTLKWKIKNIARVGKSLSTQVCIPRAVHNFKPLLTFIYIWYCAKQNCSISRGSKG